MSKRFVCSGDSCCLMPNFNFTKIQECKNNSVCYKFEVVKDSDGFCEDCINYIPLDDKTLKMQNNETCDICSKENTCCVKRLFCEHIICIVCFRKIYFKKDLTKPVFPYMNSSYSDFLNTEDDLNINNYKKDLEYWNHVQNLPYESKEKCCQGDDIV